MGLIKKFIILLLICSLLLSGLACSEKGNLEYEDKSSLVKERDYDVIVIGGDPEGVAASVAAARNGLKVLLLEDGSSLGGLMTLGMLNFIDMNYGADKTLLTQGIFADFYERVGGNAFEIDKAKALFQEMLLENEVDFQLNTELQKPILEGNKIVGVEVLDEEGIKEFYAKILIDATQDGDLSYLAGVPYTFAGEDIGEKDRIMGVTQVFELENISWPKIFTYLNFSRVMGVLKGDERKYMGAKLDSAWGYTKEGYEYIPKDPLMRLRGFNIAKQEDGKVLINALLIFDVDVLDKKSIEKAKERVQEELKYLLPYIRENFKGFEKAELVSTAEELYIRESRHIIGEYILTIDDVLENRDQWDKIALGSYPVDIQPTMQEPWGNVVGHPDRYAIPYRSIVPKEIDNLFIVGRSASYSSLAAGSARVIPIGMSVAEGAGEAASYLIENKLSPRDIIADQEAIKVIQENLKKNGAYLEDIKVEKPEVMKHWAYEGVRTLRALGILSGGYENDYQLDAEVNKWYFSYLLNNVLEKTGNNFFELEEIEDLPTNHKILEILAKSISNEGDLDSRTAFTYLKEKGILTSELEVYFQEEALAKRAELIVLIANTYNYLK